MISCSICSCSSAVNSILSVSSVTASISLTSVSSVTASISLTSVSSVAASVSLTSVSSVAASVSLTSVSSVAASVSLASVSLASVSSVTSSVSPSSVISVTLSVPAFSGTASVSSAPVSSVTLSVPAFSGSSVTVFISSVPFSSFALTFSFDFHADSVSILSELSCTSVWLSASSVSFRLFSCICPRSTTSASSISGAAVNVIQAQSSHAIIRFFITFSFRISFFSAVHTFFIII